MLKGYNKSILLLCLLTGGLLNGVHCQSLKVKYTETRKIDIPEPKEADPAMKEMIKNAGIQHMQLSYFSGTSLYEPVVKEEDDMVEHRVFIRRGDDVTSAVFKSLVENQVVKQNEFLGRTFLIRGKLKNIPWKLDAEQKVIGSYTCNKATAVIDSLDVVAWYCRDVPVNDGPDIWWGLPGLILEVNVGRGQKIITVNSVSVMNEPLVIEIPQKGKEVSQQEFDEIKREKMEEMRKMRQTGEGERVHIRVTR